MIYLFSEVTSVTLNIHCHIISNKRFVTLKTIYLPQTQAVCKEEMNPIR